MKPTIAILFILIISPIALTQTNRSKPTKNSSQQSLTARQIAQKSLPSVVLLVTEDSRGKLSALGSGFFVQEDIIATNYHVIEKASRIYAKIIGQKEIYEVSSLTAIDKDNDLALLKIKGASGTPLVLGDSHRIQIGDDVYVAGNPEGLEGTFSQGIISALRGDKYVQITAPISHGSSGGPVLNNRAEVIGVAVGIIEDGQNLNFAIPVSRLIALRQNQSIPSFDEFLRRKSQENSLPTQSTALTKGSCAIIFSSTWVGTERIAGSDSKVELRVEHNNEEIIGAWRYIDGLVPATSLYKVSGSCSNGTLVLEYGNFKSEDPYVANMIGTVDEWHVLTGKTTLRFRSGKTLSASWTLREAPDEPLSQKQNSIAPSPKPPTYFQFQKHVSPETLVNGWTNSGLVVRRGQRIRITASGYMSLKKGRDSTPAGVPAIQDNDKLMRSYPTGALIGVIGADNDDFIFIGQSREFIAQRDGVLFLGVNEGNVTDNSGAYNAVIEVEALN